MLNLRCCPGTILGKRGNAQRLLAWILETNVECCDQSDRVGKHGLVSLVVEEFSPYFGH